MTVGPRNITELHERASRPTEAVCQSLRAIDSDLLVLGAGGKMGFHLSLMLHRALESIGSPRRVLAVSRFGAPEATSGFHTHGIETLSADLLCDQSLSALPRSNYVFFLAGVKFGTANNPQLLQQINVELPARVGRHFKEARIVALSTGCVYPYSTPESGGSRESDAVAPPGAYAESCLGRERAFAQSGAATSLVRLNYSIDLRYGVLVDIAQKVLRGEPIDVDTGYVNVIWQGDANAYIIQALQRATSPPWVVNVTGSRILPVREMAERFAARFGKQADLRGQERPTAWLSNASLAHQLWGPPQVGEDQLIEWVASWILAGGETLQKPTHFEVRDGKF